MPHGSDENVTDDATEGVWPPAGIDFSQPTIARAYDATLGGKDNFAPDRAIADDLRALLPQATEAAWENRYLLERMVRWLVRDAGIDQFLDLGSGLPTVRNTHEVAHEINPAARVVYVDIDPLVLVHGRAILGGSANTDVVTGDFLKPDELLEQPEIRDTLDFTRPVAVLMIGILHHVMDEERPNEMIRSYVDRLTSGSYLAISEWVDTGMDFQQGLITTWREHMGAGTQRTPTEITEHFGSLEILDPGVVYLPLWRPDEPTSLEDLSDYHKIMMGGLARVP